MSQLDHSPYVILGVDYGCSLDEARKAFVRAVRRLRSEDSAEFEEEDLTSALHAVEQVIGDPDSAADVYRIPSDPSVYELASDGLLGASAKPLDRQSPPLSDCELARIAAAAGRERLIALATGLGDDMKALARDPYGGD